MGTEMGMVVGSVVLGSGECTPRPPEPIRYANDLLLTDLARQITCDVQELNAALTAGRLNAAFLNAHALVKKLLGLQERLNDIRYGRL